MEEDALYRPLTVSTHMQLQNIVAAERDFDEVRCCAAGSSVGHALLNGAIGARSGEISFRRQELR